MTASGASLVTANILSPRQNRQNRCQFRQFRQKRHKSSTTLLVRADLGHIAASARQAPGMVAAAGRCAAPMRGEIAMKRLSLAPSTFRGRLFVIFLAIATIPLVLTAYVFVSILAANIEKETIAKLSFVRDAKRAEVTQYVTFAMRQAESLTQSNAVRYSIGDFYGFSYAFRMIDE